VLYTPLKPSIFSLGGIFLAFGMLLVAKFYEEIMNLQFFFYITILVELTVLAFVTFFLVFNYSYMTALVIYLGYQLTFVFGSYLVRMETIALKKTKLISFADITKQKGYLGGLVISYMFYKILGFFKVTNKQIQVYDLHYGVFSLQLLILFLVYKAFYKKMI
jgi:hypothetical protein